METRLLKDAWADGGGVAGLDGDGRESGVGWPGTQATVLPAAKLLSVQLAVPCIVAEGGSGGLMLSNV